MTPDYPARPERKGRRAAKRGDPRPGERGEREPTRRLFVACDLPGDVLDAVRRWQLEELAPRDELRVAATLHLTLCFLGDLVLPPLPATFEPPLFRPERGPKRVVALGLTDPAGTLRATQRSVSDALYRLSVYTPEKRPWLPHVTVARYRRPGQPFSLQNVTIPPFGLPAVILYASVLERGGAVHTPLATFPTVS